MKRLISDGGEMVVGRRTASWVWGRFDVTLADGDTSAAADDRIVDGYVYRPDDRQTGLFDLTFVRADARLDMNAEQSDLEATLDGASRRTEGGAFHTKTISGDGLARTRPGVDYRRGDKVEVLVWGKTMTLPVTGITATSSLDDPLGWEVQVGGQLVRDAEALRKRNSDLAAQIAAEKRQRMKEAGIIRSAVDEEQDTRIAEMEEVRASLAAEQNERINEISTVVDRVGRMYADMVAVDDAYRHYELTAPNSYRLSVYGTMDVAGDHLPGDRYHVLPSFTCGHTGVYDFRVVALISPVNSDRRKWTPWGVAGEAPTSTPGIDDAPGAHMTPVSGVRHMILKARKTLTAGQQYRYGAFGVRTWDADPSRPTIGRAWTISAECSVSLVPGGGD